MTGSVTPEIKSNPISFIINPGDLLVIKAVLNPGANKKDDPDDFLFEWCVNYAL